MPLSPNARLLSGAGLRALGAAAVASVLSASNRAMMPYQNGGITQARWLYSRSYHRTRASGTKVRVHMTNGFVSAGANGIETAGSGAMQFRCGILTGITVGASSSTGNQASATVYQCKWFGMLANGAFVGAGGAVSSDGLTITIPVGMSVVSDPVDGLSLTKNQEYFAQVEALLPANGVQWNTPRNAAIGEQSGYNQGAPPTDPAGSFAFGKNFGNNGLTYVLTPVAITLEGAPGAKCVMLHGDSIEFGKDATNPDANVALLGPYRQALDALGYNFVAVLTPGANIYTMFSNQAGNTAMRAYYTGIADHGAIITDMGHNDRAQDGDYSNVSARFQWWWGALRAWLRSGVSTRIIQTTLCPNTSSTDSWATEANQTVNGSATHWKRTFNPALRAGNFGLLGTGGNKPDACYDMSLVVEASDTLKWKANATFDGTHPQAAVTNTIGDTAIYNDLITKLPALLGFDPAP